MSEQSLLMARLAALEAEAAIRRLVSDYLHLCENLTSDEVAQEVGRLFTADAQWLGTGPLYAATLGSHCGRQAITAMMAGYACDPPHFVINVHFLTAEFISVLSADSAAGRWKMCQLAALSDNSASAKAAELFINFRREEGRWLISHFSTRNLFSRPLDYLHAPLA